MLVAIALLNTLPAMLGLSTYVALLGRQAVLCRMPSEHGVVVLWLSLLIVVGRVMSALESQPSSETLRGPSEWCCVSTCKFIRPERVQN